MSDASAGHAGTAAETTDGVRDQSRVLVRRASWISMRKSDILLWRIPSAVSTLPPPYAEPMDKVVKSCATFLTRWRGATAETSELAWPRGALRIVLRADGRLGNLVLTCLDPVW